MRPSERLADVLRPVTLETGVNRYAEGSCLVSFGHTKVLVTASLEEGVPGFLRGKGQGWITAEYGMLPRATHTRGEREASRGRQGGRTHEIQRLIGRALRSVVALCDAIAWMRERSMLTADPVREGVAAVSVGIVEGVPLLDLDYAEDSGCDT